VQKKDGLSKYKLIKIATESLRNSLRLHFDAILLYNNDSYPSAYQLSVLSLEEFSKALWIEHYIDASETNTGYSTASDEHEWLKLLYLHPKKQWNFVAREFFNYSPKFIKLIESRELENRKQNATYVGLSRSKGTINIDARISLPWQIKQKDAKQMISIINSEFLRICKLIEDDDDNCYFSYSARKMDTVFDYEIFKKLLSWPHRTGLKHSSWRSKNLTPKRN
jgi:AbiV family abortive infection protein